MFLNMWNILFYTYHVHQQPHPDLHMFLTHTKYQKYINMTYIYTYIDEYT